MVSISHGSIAWVSWRVGCWATGQTEPGRRGRWVRALRHAGVGYGLCRSGGVEAPCGGFGRGGVMPTLLGAVMTGWCAVTTEGRDAGLFWTPRRKIRRRRPMLDGTALHRRTHT
ncbi:hypothetical protein GCM10017557_10290 [Streptomyces aurantiacus]|uniref:Uncharacterized protein n=1 Tax=Streptomyces aurantiacus TaxID=47760 RepID=A0A7G1NWS7_9ACTN|nr:hypothetical protein GCM10017557_10290 [Streptomyces aurantiacus]